ncbi:LysR family transcriptional regulator [Pseudomonas saudiphocaensis]|uniref:LysR family transcriptional regulator n=1 Tax=Pseudomonas saudiphocaensis TaxID=1499686 RepID=UPI000F78B911|nr:LysR family transcriptional regulator [Pseudomonas saudiphocaensis]MBE7926959.1 LysR family transcriptional regulator [Pseudomonas saudiphocaensis]RRV15023.1 LysR family transcriptional regulator [Pseudomonas saudiphocaensis]
MKTDLKLLPLFIAVAQSDNFRAAADRLGITRSAVSQGMRKLEDSLGITLVQRSTRNVRLTEAGEQLYRQLAEPLGKVTTALEAVTAESSPRGLLRVAVTSIAERFLSGPFIVSFAEAYPGVVLDITVTDDESDIVAAGFDAGVRLGEVIEQDMVAIPITGLQRQVTVASPAYLAAHGTPRHPRELIAHHCIGWRPAPEVAPYRWEFGENGRDFDVSVEPRITTNDMQLMIRTALAGGGITIGMEETFQPYIERGELVSLLDDFLPPFPGFYLYYPSRHNQPPKLRALIDHVRARRLADGL